MDAALSGKENAMVGRGVHSRNTIWNRSLAHRSLSEVITKNISPSQTRKGISCDMVSPGRGRGCPWGNGVAHAHCLLGVMYFFVHFPKPKWALPKFQKQNSSFSVLAIFCTVQPFPFSKYWGHSIAPKTTSANAASASP